MDGVLTSSYLGVLKMTPECVERIETLIEKFQNGEAGQFSAKYDELQQVRLDYSVEHSNIDIFLWCPMT